MSDSPMSDSGLFIMLILLDFRSFLTESDLPAIVLAESHDAECDERPAQREGNSDRSYTWLIHATVKGNLVDLCPQSTFIALLDSAKQRQQECIGAAATITLTCSSDVYVTEHRKFSVQGFVHGNRENRGAVR